MDVSNLSTLISTVGFPVVMCGALLWYLMKVTEQHADESKEMREAINALQVAITELTDHIKGGAS